MSPDSHSVQPGDSIRLRKHCHQVHALAVQGHRRPLLPADCDRLSLLGSVPRPHTHARLHERRRYLDVLQVSCLVGQTQKVGIGRVAGLSRRPNGQLIRLTVFDHLLPAGKPVHELRVSPRSVDLQRRVQDVGRKLETYLVVATPRGAVKQHADLTLPKLWKDCGDGDGSCYARRVPVPTFVAGLGL